MGTSPRAGQPSLSPARQAKAHWARHLLSLCTGQPAGQATVTKNKPRVLKVENGFIECPVSGPGW